MSKFFSDLKKNYNTTIKGIKSLGKPEVTNLALCGGMYVGGVTVATVATTKAIAVAGAAVAGAGATGIAFGLIRGFVTGKFIEEMEVSSIKQ